MRAALAAVLALLVGGGAAPTGTERLVQRLERGGVRCDERRAFSPRGLERAEERCRTFAIATFTTSARRARWMSARARESWFPAAYIAYGPRWTLWTSSRHLAERARDILDGRLVTLQLPAPVPRIEKRCDSLPPARPSPIGPRGPVYSYKRAVWDTSETDTCTGLVVVARTSPFSSALTGVAQSWRDGGPLSGIPVVLRSTHVDGVEDAPPTLLRTVTDRQGGYAFIDVPVAPRGSCYVLTMEAGSFGTFEYTGFFAAGEEYQQTVDMEFAGVGDGDAGCFPQRAAR